MELTYQNWMPLPGEMILEFSHHAHQRLQQRQISYSMIEQTVMNGRQSPGGKGSIRFEYGIVTVVIEKVTPTWYRVITAWV